MQREIMQLPDVDLRRPLLIEGVGYTLRDHHIVRSIQGVLFKRCAHRRLVAGFAMPEVDYIALYLGDGYRL